jgi:hypothetical protein
MSPLVDLRSDIQQGFPQRALTGSASGQLQVCLDSHRQRAGTKCPSLCHQAPKCSELLWVGVSQRDTSRRQIAPRARVKRSYTSGELAIERISRSRSGVMRCTSSL